MLPIQEAESVMTMISIVSYDSKGSLVLQRGLAAACCSDGRDIEVDSGCRPHIYFQDFELLPYGFQRALLVIVIQAQRRCSRRCPLLRQQKHQLHL